MGVPSPDADESFGLLRMEARLGEFDVLPVQAKAAHVAIPKVMVVSPVLLYREGLAASLSGDGRVEVIATTDPAAATAEALATTPDAVLFDATGEEALAMARQLKRTDPSIVLVGFGISETAVAAVACAEAGLAAFIDEEGSVDSLVSTTLSALRGEFCCSPRVTAQLCERLAALASASRAAPSAAADSLTTREKQIAALVSEGLSNKEIALGLRIGPATVKNHVHNILDKLGVRRRAAIAARVSEAK
jgi:two-component system, NarL family, nitrate/nitrite response regulator NarL